MTVYKKQALQYEDGIPIFCNQDDYVKNYDVIADVLLENLKKEGTNPWMDEEYWKSAEGDTAEICSQYIKAGDKVLDIGCGTGRMLSCLSGVEKFGIDISVAMVKMCREKGIEACMGNVEDLPYLDESMDMIICTDVLEHVFDLHKTLSEINRVVKRGGHIILRVPQNEDLSPYLEPSYPFEYVHLRMFSKSSLQLYCTKVFKMGFLQARDTYREKRWLGWKKILFFPKIFTKIIGRGILVINSKIWDNEKFCRLFRERQIRYVEIIEAFKKEG